MIPARVTGSLEGGNGVTPLALAVGQRVVSTTLSYFFPDDQDWRFSFIVPPELLPEGCVSFELYEIPDAADGELQPIAIRNAIDCGN